jgi:hypothetical protein
MFKKILVSDLISEGAQLLEALGRNRFPVIAALWNYFPESMEWRLVIVSPAVDHNGPINAYTRVQRVLAGIEAAQLTLTNMVLIGPNSQDYRDLREIFSRLGRFSHPGTHSAQSVVFEDSYVYPVTVPQR